MPRVRLSGRHDELELRIRDQTRADDAARQAGAVGRLGRRDRGEGRRLDQTGGMRLQVGMGGDLGHPVLVDGIRIDRTGANRTLPGEFHHGVRILVVFARAGFGGDAFHCDQRGGQGAARAPRHGVGESDRARGRGDGPGLVVRRIDAGDRDRVVLVARRDHESVVRIDVGAERCQQRAGDGTAGPADHAVASLDAQRAQRQPARERGMVVRQSRIVRQTPELGQRGPPVRCRRIDVPEQMGDRESKGLFGHIDRDVELAALADLFGRDFRRDRGHAAGFPSSSSLREPPAP